MTDHPITPPPELLREWCRSSREHKDLEQFWRYIATQAAQWAADQELEACCEWLEARGYSRLAADELRAARRPKPPSLKEQALKRIEALEKLAEAMGHDPDNTIRRAIETLPDE